MCKFGHETRPCLEEKWVASFLVWCVSVCRVYARSVGARREVEAKLAELRVGWGGGYLLCREETRESIRVCACRVEDGPRSHTRHLHTRMLSPRARAHTHAPRIRTLSLTRPERAFVCVHVV